MLQPPLTVMVRSPQRGMVKKKKKKNASDFARLGLQDQNHQSHIGYLYDGTYMTRKSLRAEYTSQMSLTYLEAVSSAKN